VKKKEVEQKMQNHDCAKRRCLDLREMGEAHGREGVDYKSCTTKGRKNLQSYRDTWEFRPSQAFRKTFVSMGQVIVPRKGYRGEGTSKKSSPESEYGPRVSPHKRRPREDCNQKRPGKKRGSPPANRTTSQSSRKWGRSVLSILKIRQTWRR